MTVLLLTKRGFCGIFICQITMKMLLTSQSEPLYILLCNKAGGKIGSMSLSIAMIRKLTHSAPPKDGLRISLVQAR